MLRLRRALERMGDTNRRLADGLDALQHAEWLVRTEGAVILAAREEDVPENEIGCSNPMAKAVTTCAISVGRSCKQ